MILKIVIRAALLAGAAALAMTLPPLPAWGAWTAAMTALCVIGAALIASQPMGTPTFAGRIGSQFVRWGFRAGGGRLWLATVMSVVIWSLLGAGIIGITTHRQQPVTALLWLSWLIDAMALLYITGLILRRRHDKSRIPKPTRIVIAALLAMLAGSVCLHFLVGASGVALLIAGAPPLLVGGGYGIFLGLMLTLGRKARWN